MTFNWYKIFNQTEFDALDLISKTYSYFIDGQGYKDILVTKGNLTSVSFDDVFLPVNLNDENPFINITEGKAVYIDENDDVWIGYEIE